MYNVEIFVFFYKWLLVSSITILCIINLCILFIFILIEKNVATLNIVHIIF